MENGNFISLPELILLNIYLGSIIFLLSTFLLFFIIKGKNRLNVVVFTIISQLGSAILLSLLLWKLWPFKTDVMYGFVFYPALFSEIVTILFTLYILKIIRDKQKD